MKMIVSTVAIAICFLIGCTQSDGKVNVPEVVKAKFTSMYPNAGSPEWEMEDGKYEATFKQDNIETSVLFSSDGNLLQTETEMDASMLPQPVKDYVSSQLGGKNISEAVMITDAHGMVSYEAEVDSSDFLFDSNGLFVSKENPEEGEDEE